MPLAPDVAEVDEERGVARPRHAPLERRSRPSPGSSARRPADPTGSVHPRARVTVGIDRVAAPHARRAAGGDELVGVVAEGGGLAAGHVQPDVTAVGGLGSPPRRRRRRRWRRAPRAGRGRGRCRGRSRARSARARTTARRAVSTAPGIGRSSGGGRSLSTRRRYWAIAVTCCFSHFTVTRSSPARACR